MRACVRERERESCWMEGEEGKREEKSRLEGMEMWNVECVICDVENVMERGVVKSSRVEAR